MRGLHDHNLFTLKINGNGIFSVTDKRHGFLGYLTGNGPAVTFRNIFAFFRREKSERVFLFQNAKARFVYYLFVKYTVTNCLCKSCGGVPCVVGTEDNITARCNGTDSTHVRIAAVLFGFGHARHTHSVGIHNALKAEFTAKKIGHDSL